MITIVGTAGNGTQAVTAAANLRPQLVIMDINMPEMDGLSAARLIRQNNSGTGVVLMSGEDSSTLRQQCRSCGAHAFIHKSKLRRELPRVLQEVLAGARLRQFPTNSHPKGQTA